MVCFERYVAIGDSATEGLEDPDGNGGYRGWADRLAQHIADGQDEPLDYANLAVRGLRLDEIRNTQFDDALAMKPDLMTIFGGVNDVLSFGCDYDQLAATFAEMYSEARGNDITVLTFTMPDPTAINPFGRRLRDRMFRLNDLVRAEAARYGVIVLDLQAYPMAGDPRLWYEDKLHGNPLGHERVARGLAWRLGIARMDESWAEPLPPVSTRSVREQLTEELDWAVTHLAPWLGKGIRGVPHGDGIVAKRPALTLVSKTRPDVPRSLDQSTGSGKLMPRSAARRAP
ncbi:SGNH/GDSL hydrolase family protein [Microlunatus parietis]|uniref:Lysophospholipase L1-like esterase n=1 Tax=Microlunatus parietis TaxID=682979 RepID=A0A7Y9I902_9ACTN|nr:SGNH/GDSL hydrolase family protein [Microlunatus parietis]NYE71974.1 lysophospholipase L1-like esterase [Microlunatus parietis]